MPNLAARMSRARPSAIMAVADKARRLRTEGRNIVNFSIGVPNFLPGEHVYAAVRDALAKDSGQYGSNRGADALLDAFLGHLEGSGLTGYARRNVATGIGAKHVLYNLAEALLDPGDTIAFTVPYWTSYMDIAEIVDAKVRLLPCPASQNYKLTPAQLLLKVRCMYVCMYVCMCVCERERVCVCVVCERFAVVVRIGDFLNVEGSAPNFIDAI